MSDTATIVSAVVGAIWSAILLFVAVVRQFVIVLKQYWFMQHIAYPDYRGKLSAPVRVVLDAVLLYSKHSTLKLAMFWKQLQAPPTDLMASITSLSDAQEVLAECYSPVIPTTDILRPLWSVIGDEPTSHFYFDGTFPAGLLLIEYKRQITSPIQRHLIQCSGSDHVRHLQYAPQQRITDACLEMTDAHDEVDVTEFLNSFTQPVNPYLAVALGYIESRNLELEYL
jgi:hypothetical protein